jgi:hypothetical protein
MLINTEYKKDLITFDSRLKQLRYLHNYKELGRIEFIDLSFTDVEILESAYTNNLKEFFDYLRYDLFDFANIRVTSKGMKLRIQQEA